LMGAALAYLACIATGPRKRSAAGQIQTARMVKYLTKTVK